MSENKNSMVVTAMNYAIPLGLFWLFKYLFVIGGEHYDRIKYINSVLGVVTPILAYILVIRYRDKHKGGRILYGESILFILLIFGFASFIETVVTSLHLLVINPELVPQMNEKIHTMMSKFHFSDSMIIQLDTMLDIYGAGYYIVAFIIQNLIIGLFLSIVLGYFVSRPTHKPHQNI